MASALSRFRRVRTPNPRPEERSPLTKTTAIIICSSEDPEVIAGAVESLTRQDQPPDEVVVVDNSPDARHQQALAGFGVVYHAARANLGFPGGVNRGADLARGEFLFLLNPDAAAAPDCLRLLVAELESEPGAAIAGAQILLPDGRVNAGDNPIHLTGICWAGNFRGPREHGPARPVLSVSGAAMLIRAEDFRRLGGFSPAIFMYFDDADLGWRSRIAGRSVIFCPEAVVEHDYEFDKGPRKWTWLEESRIAAVLSNYEGRTLLLLGPLLVATELAICLAALRGGWIRQKLLAYRSVWRRRGLIRGSRRATQSSRVVSDRELMPEFAEVVASPVLDSAAMRLAAVPQRFYARLMRALMR